MEKARRPEPITTVEVVFPTDTNHYGTLFGGKLISWMDKAAYYAAIRFCGTAAVTASVERLDFGTSLRQGDLVELEARVVFSGSTSMVIRVDVFRFALGEDRRGPLTTTGYFTFVALGEDGRPRPVPALRIESPEEERLHGIGAGIHAEAKRRRRKEPPPPRGSSR